MGRIKSISEFRAALNSIVRPGSQRARRNMAMEFDGIKFDTVEELMAYKAAQSKAGASFGKAGAARGRPVTKAAIAPAPVRAPQAAPRRASGQAQRHVSSPDAEVSYNQGAFIAAAVGGMDTFCPQSLVQARAAGQKVTNANALTAIGLTRGKASDVIDALKKAGIDPAPRQWGFQRLVGSQAAKAQQILAAVGGVSCTFASARSRVPDAAEFEEIGLDALRARKNNGASYWDTHCSECEAPVKKRGMCRRCAAAEAGDSAEARGYLGFEKDATSREWGKVKRNPESNFWAPAYANWTSAPEYAYDQFYRGISNPRKSRAKKNSPPRGPNIVMLMGEDGGPMGGEWAQWAQDRAGVMHRNPKPVFDRPEGFLRQEALKPTFDRPRGYFDLPQQRLVPHTTSVMPEFSYRSAVTSVPSAAAAPVAAAAAAITPAAVTRTGSAAPKVEYVPVADNAGPFLPEMFPYGQGGRPAIYKNPAVFAIPERQAWPISDETHGKIAIQYMKRGFGKRSDYARVAKAIGKRYPHLKRAAEKAARG